MGTEYLIDSNAVIDYLSGKLPVNGMSFMNDIINAIPKVSVITKIEVLGYNAPSDAYKLLSEFIYDSNVYELTEAIVDRTIELRKKYKTKLPDAILAATALTHELALISRNVSDFKNISGLKVVDPHKV